MWWLRVIILLLLLPFPLLFHKGTCSTSDHACPPSSCGKISNIIYPFRLKDDPIHCGDKSYELSCENKVTTLYLYSLKYLVQSINYNNFTIRLVDPDVQESNCSSFPLHSISQSNFCDTYEHEDKYCQDPYQAAVRDPNNNLLFEHIVYLNCSHQVTNNPKYVDTVPCVDWNSKSKGYYIYAMSGDLIAEDFQVGCHVKLVAPTSWLRNLEGNEVVSYDEMHKALVYGFEISWLNVPCKNLHCGDSNFCSFNAATEKLQCFCDSFWGGDQNLCGITHF